MALLPLPPPPPGLDLAADRRPAIVAVSVLTWALALAAVGLRLLSRHIKRVPLWIDDWLIIAALVRPPPPPSRLPPRARTTDPPPPAVLVRPRRRHGRLRCAPTALPPPRPLPSLSPALTAQP